MNTKPKKEFEYKDTTDPAKVVRPVQEIVHPNLLKGGWAIVLHYSRRNHALKSNVTLNQLISWKEGELGTVRLKT